MADLCGVIRELFPAGMIVQVVGQFALRIIQSPIEILAVGRPLNRVSVSRVAVARNWNGPINGYRETRRRGTPTPSRVTTGPVTPIRMAGIRAVRIAAVEPRLCVMWPVPIPG